MTPSGVTSTIIPAPLPASVLLPVTNQSPLGAASGCLLLLSCWHLLAHGGSTTCVSPFQRTEAIAAAAGLSCFHLPASNQTSVQAQSCCGSRSRSETSWKRTVRKTAVPIQVVFHLKCVWDEDFLHLWSPHGNNFSCQGNWTSGTLHSFSSSADAQSRNSSKIFVIM